MESGWAKFLEAAISLILWTSGVYPKAIFDKIPSYQVKHFQDGY
jgi:hypothetical protein